MSRNWKLCQKIRMSMRLTGLEITLYPSNRRITSDGPVSDCSGATRSLYERPQCALYWTALPPPLSLNANDLRKPKTEPFLVIGKAIYWPAETTATLPLSRTLGKKTPPRRVLTWCGDPIAVFRRAKTFARSRASHRGRYDL